METFLFTMKKMNIDISNINIKIARQDEVVSFDKEQNLIKS